MQIGTLEVREGEVMLAQAATQGGRIIGVVCGAAAALAWSFAMWVPSAGVASPIGFVGSFALALLALFGAIAAVRGHAAVVVVVFLASFFPVGFAFLSAENWMRAVGYLDLGLLAAAVLLYVGRRLGAAAVEPAEQESAR